MTYIMILIEFSCSEELRRLFVEDVIEWVEVLDEWEILKHLKE